MIHKVKGNTKLGYFDAALIQLKKETVDFFIENNKKVTKFGISTSLTLGKTYQKRDIMEGDRLIYKDIWQTLVIHTEICSNIYPQLKQIQSFQQKEDTFSAKGDSGSCLFEQKDLHSILYARDKSNIKVTYSWDLKNYLRFLEEEIDKKDFEISFDVDPFVINY